MSFFIRKRGGARGGTSISRQTDVPKKLSDRVAGNGVSRRGRGAGRRGAPVGRGRKRGGDGEEGGYRGVGKRKRIGNEQKSAPEGDDDEEITSEEDDEAEAEPEPIATDEEEETVQEARIRIAKQQISELKKRLGSRGGDGDDDDEEDEDSFVAKVLRENEMVEDGKVLRKVLPEGLEARVLDVEVVGRGGKVLKSPLTCVTTTTNPDGDLRVYGSTKSGHVVAYDVLKKTRTGAVHLGGSVTCVCGSWEVIVASGGKDAEVFVLHPVSLEKLRKVGNGRGVVWMSLGGGGSLYTAHKDRTVKVWDLGGSEGAGGFVEALFGHQDSVMFVDCVRGKGGGDNKNSGDRVLSAGGFDKTVRMWKIEEDSHLVYNWGGEGSEDVVVDVVRWIGGGCFIAGGCGGGLGLFDVGKKKPMDVVRRAHGCSGGDVARWITAIGGFGDFVASGSDDGVVKIWRVKSIGGRRKRLEFVRDVDCGVGVVIGIDVVGRNEGVWLVVGLGTEMRNGRWGGRVGNSSRIVVVKC